MKISADWNWDLTNRGSTHLSCSFFLLWAAVIKSIDVKMVMFTKLDIIRYQNKPSVKCHVYTKKKKGPVMLVFLMIRIWQMTAENNSWEGTCLYPQHKHKHNTQVNTSFIVCIEVQWKAFPANLAVFIPEHKMGGIIVYQFLDLKERSQRLWTYMLDHVLRPKGYLCFTAFHQISPKFIQRPQDDFWCQGQYLLVTAHNCKVIINN